jgi:hypothetical protein
VLCYLAVAHFGRGRGVWQEGEQPQTWREAVDRVAVEEAEAVEEVWKLGVEKEAMPDVIVRESHRLAKRLTQKVLRILYSEMR